MSKGDGTRPTNKPKFDAESDRIKANHKCNPNKQTKACSNCNCYWALRKGK